MFGRKSSRTKKKTNTQIFTKIGKKEEGALFKCKGLTGVHVPSPPPVLPSS